MLKHLYNLAIVLVVTANVLAAKFNCDIIDIGNSNVNYCCSNWRGMTLNEARLALGLGQLNDLIIVVGK